MNRILEAFPPTMASDVRAVARLLTSSEHPTSARDIGAVDVGGHPVRIPARIYHQPPGVTAASELTDRQHIILGCILTRHHDGHVRERALLDIVGSLDPWVPPFVVQLLGEYVAKILEALDATLLPTHRMVYGAFLQENPGFHQLTRQRVASYWDCYFRAASPDREVYVGFRLLRRLDAWRDSMGPLPAA